MGYDFWKPTLGVIATIGLYSVLYRENKFYRLFEHLFLGLATGWTLLILWTEILKPNWYDNIVGKTAENGSAAAPGYWAYVLLLPIGLMGYFVFSRKHNWMSRVPIGIILGLWSGQQIQVWYNRYGPQIADSMRPVFPNTYSSFTVPADAAAGAVYPTQALTNIIFVVTLLSVLSYFLFSFDLKSKALRNMTTMGRWLLMIGFGAIFGSTVMMRFTLLIDRMYFIFIEWAQTVLGQG